MRRCRFDAVVADERAGAEIEPVPASGRVKAVNEVITEQRRCGVWVGVCVGVRLAALVLGAPALTVPGLAMLRLVPFGNCKRSAPRDPDEGSNRSCAEHPDESSPRYRSTRSTGRDDRHFGPLVH